MINPLVMALIKQDFPDAISYIYLNEMPLVEIVGKDGETFVEMPYKVFKALYIPSVTLV